MCIIVYKPKENKMPEKETLRTCFDNNPHGAGYMYNADNCVHIRKGFDKFESFYTSVMDTTKKYGFRIPMVFHFRISTQAHGRMDCTHPFPLSRNMNDLRKLKVKCNIGIAHNGIISITSSYSRNIDYSDTMKFITDFASLIIHNNDYYKQKDNLLLLERICESKLAIMNSKGNVQLIGNGWVEKDGNWYSNSSFEKPKISTFSTSAKCDYDRYYGKYGYDIYDDYSMSDFDSYQKYDDYVFYWEQFFNEKTYLYDFDIMDCPLSDPEFNDDSYCKMCSRYKTCYKDMFDSETLDRNQKQAIEENK